ncbi:hypothetical protein CUMW_022850 [Citrus unshiu]|nr:hypothetical protein CUMW_022850 [Citrus unshiu]
MGQKVHSRNETFERLATIGLLANFMVYLLKEYHMNQTSAANILNIWGGVTNFAPLLGAFISDTYTGRFKTITFASIAAILLAGGALCNKISRKGSSCGI